MAVPTDAPPAAAPETTGEAFLDHAAGSPLRPEVLDAMLPWMGGRPANPSGAHSSARAARRALEEARQVVASALGVPAGGVVFTGSGTEADNLGLHAHRPGADGVVLASAVEHPAVLEPLRHGSRPWRTVPVGPDGVADLGRLAALVDEVDGRVALLSLMTANNETGVLQPLDAAAAVVRRRAPHAVVHTDAVQALPWLDLAQVCAPADAISVSAHKLGGPQGVGALGLRDGVAVDPVLRGGGQERDRRPGTHNLAGIVGFAAAVSAVVARRRWETQRVAELRRRLVEGILHAVPGATETAPGAPRLPGHAHLRFAGVESETLLLLLDAAGVRASAGSACASGAIEPSPVLVAMGASESEALSSLRLSLGWDSTDADVDLVLAVLPEAVARARDAR